MQTNRKELQDILSNLIMRRQQILNEFSIFKDEVSAYPLIFANHKKIISNLEELIDVAGNLLLSWSIGVK